MVRGGGQGAGSSGGLRSGCYLVRLLRMAACSTEPPAGQGLRCAIHARHGERNTLQMLQKGASAIHLFFGCCLKLAWPRVHQ
jgi:hypothetical protein